MMTVPGSVDEIIAPLDVQLRDRERGNETPLCEVLGYQDTSPQRDAFASDGSFN